MTWFKVDDGLHKHRKRIRCGLDMEGFAALGLWTTAGSWSADELTDGWIPDDVIDYLAPGLGQQLAKRLERACLWDRVTRDGEEGWEFHEWTDHQPTREQVLADRAAAALRQKRARDRAREKREEEGQEGDASRRDSHVTDAETHGDVTPPVTVPPTRPDPTLEEPPSSNGLFEEPAKPTAPKPGSDDDPNWIRFWAAYPKKTSKKNARTRWASALKQKHNPEDIILGAQRYAERVKRERTEYRYVKHPDGWLNGELWRDETPPPSLYPPMNAPYRGQAGVVESNAPKRYSREERCTTHTSYPAANCGPCRADRLAESRA
ncbi:hypothetical protein AB0L22_08805 [Micromonospora haikouensis]|uniref:hypothetical protein n=1 Tax=Micromonospora haikouensis TaxID=686309 RepID=UPI0034442BEC